MRLPHLPHRLPISLDLIATVGAVAAMGLAVLIIGSAAPGVNHYLLPVIFAVMVVPVIIYVRSGRIGQVATGEKLAVPRVEAPPMSVAAPEPAPRATPPTPVVAAAPIVPPAPAPVALAAPPAPVPVPIDRTEAEEIVELKESLSKIETQLRSIQAVQLSMLENITHSMSVPTPPAATAPAPQAQPPATPKKREEEPLAPIGLPLPPESKPRGVIRVKDLETKQGDERGAQGEQETAAEKMTEETASITPKKASRSLKTEQAEEPVEDEEGGVKAKRVGKGAAGVGKPAASEKEAKTEPLTRMEELNLLREELVKLRMKLDVEPRPK